MRIGKVKNNLVKELKTEKKYTYVSVSYLPLKGVVANPIFAV